MEYTDNQITAIKRLQFLSFNDKEFMTLTGFRNMSFRDVVKCGFWSASELEEIGEQITSRQRQRTFYFSSGRKEGRKKRRLPHGAGAQFTNKSRAIGKRDGTTFHQPKVQR